MKLLKKLPLNNHPVTPLRKDSEPNVVVEVVAMLVHLMKDIGEETSKTQLVMVLFANMVATIIKVKFGMVNHIMEVLITTI